MRVLIEPSSYHLQNAGDNAMLRVCAQRILARWPEAELHVATESPGRLEKIFPAAIPATRYVELRDATLGVGNSFDQHRPSRIERFLKRRIQDPAKALFAERASRADCRRFERHARFPLLCNYASQFDLAIGTGGGYLTDFHPAQARRVLWTLRLAQAMGVPTAVFGQGIGPYTRGPLEHLTAEVLGRTQLIGLREAKHGTELLRRWGIDMSRVVATGDDALELARNLDAPQAGQRIGFNVRVCHYAGVGADDAKRVLRVVEEFAAREQVQLQPIVVTTNAGESDDTAIEQAADAMLPGGADDESALITSISACRLVVTGSYHAAVFALAQGIPAIGIVGSDYYLHKFAGLAELFGDGCTLYHLDRDSEVDLHALIASQWNVPPAVREGLRRSADQQIALGQSLYNRLTSIAGPRPSHSVREYSPCA